MRVKKVFLYYYYLIGADLRIIFALLSQARPLPFSVKVMGMAI
jgi:hypothetical protein